MGLLALVLDSAVKDSQQLVVVNQEDARKTVAAIINGTLSETDQESIFTVMSSITKHRLLDDYTCWSGVRDSYIASMICIFISLAPEVCHPDHDEDQENQKYAMRFGTIIFFTWMGLALGWFSYVSIGVSVTVGGVVSLLQWGIELLLCTEAFRTRTCLFLESFGCRCCGYRKKIARDKRRGSGTPTFEKTV